MPLKQPTQHPINAKTDNSRRNFTKGLTTVLIAVPYAVRAEQGPLRARINYRKYTLFCCSNGKRICERQIRQSKRIQVPQPIKSGLDKIARIAKKKTPTNLGASSILFHTRVFIL